MGARTKMSSRGQVILPKRLRDAHGWTAGTEFEVIDGASGVELKPLLPPDGPRVGKPDRVSMEQFLQMIPRRSPEPITDEMIDEAIGAEARRQWNDPSRS